MRLVQVFLITVMVVTTALTISATEQEAEEDFLPIGLTEEEKQRLDEIGMMHRSTAPPSGQVRNSAEWEPSQGVIIRWPLGIPLELVAEYSQDLVVVTIVASTSQQSSAISAYNGAGVNMSNLDWIFASTNSIWTRDYGPWFIFEEGGDMAIVDHIYNRPRPLDDVIPQHIGSAWGLNVYGMDLEHTGGNHMSDGLGMSMSTELVYDENPSLTEAQVDSIMYAYLNNDYTVLEYIEYSGIHHIDCWAKFLDPQTILVKDVPPSSSSYDLLNARADSLRQQMGPWGRPYEVVRIYCPYGTAYTNSIILNDKVFVPLFNSSYDDDAMQTYRDAMPGYQVLGFTGSWYDNDAIHCRAMGVPDSNMLFIDHIPLFDTEDSKEDYLVTAIIVDHSDAGIVTEQTQIYYETGDSIWNTAPLYATADPDSFYGYIPAQSPGTIVRYYLQAADNSFRVEKHPYIGAPGAHEFTVLEPNVPPELICPDSLLWQAGGRCSFCPGVVDPDDTSHTFTYQAYPDWLSQVGDSLIGTAPDTNETFGFLVSVSDGSDVDQTAVVVHVFICGDVNRDNNVNVTDIVAIIALVFASSDQYPLLEPFDVNCDDITNVSDVVYLIDFVFDDGPVPCEDCN
jgi:agmatine/peptidylarginine deiminase